MKRWKPARAIGVALTVATALVVSACGSSASTDTSTSSTAGRATGATSSSASTAMTSTSTSSSSATSTGAGTSTSAASEGATTSAGGGGAAGGQTISVGAIPSSASNLGLWYAEQTEFPQKGITVNAVATQGAQQGIPLLLNGQIQFLLGDAVSGMVAASQGIEVQMVAMAQLGGTTAENDTSAVITSADGPKSLADLEGKTVAVNALKGIAQIILSESMKSVGADPDKVQWVALDAGATIPAIQNGTVDAGVLSEPFLTTATNAGLVSIANPFATSGLTGAPQAVFYASKQFIAENPDIVKTFADAITTANATVAKDPDAARTVLAGQTKIDPAVLSKMRLPLTSPATLSADGLQKLDDVLVKYGVLQDSVDVASLIYTSS